MGQVRVSDAGPPILFGTGRPLTGAGFWANTELAMMEYSARQIEPDSYRIGRIDRWQAVLTVVGLVLITWGAAPCLRFAILAAFIGLSWPMEKVGLMGLVLGLGLLWLVPARLLHAIPRIVIGCFASAWLLSCVPHFVRNFAGLLFNSTTERYSS